MKREYEVKDQVVESVLKKITNRTKKRFEK